MYITNHPSGTFNTERPTDRRVCGNVMITRGSRLGVCVLTPGHESCCLPSPYLGR